MTMSAPSPGQRLQKQRETPTRGLQSRPSPSDPPPTAPAQLGGGGGARAPGRPHARAPHPRAMRRGTGSDDGAGQRPPGGVGREEAAAAEKRQEASALNNKRISEAWEVQDQGVSRFGVCRTSQTFMFI
ncbi:translation initiation factor IF-2-like [Physeter macrocephalus]|uniref:Translation initiation factor IF-2-like n=1 Tax=Physeter macrocephalus TaxID=9755 RepID=A0A9W2X687_PHYMC|nr:translation initiation factor IF-2-like [Physeter catodon]